MTTLDNTSALEGADAPDLTTLLDSVSGSVLQPGEAGFAEASTGWNLAAVTRPLLVVVARDAADVAATVRWAGVRGYPVAVTGTGHGAGADVTGHVLVNTSQLDELSMDNEGVVRAGAGVIWQQVLDVCAARGRAPLAGSFPGVGVAGFLTGGGLGPIARSAGLSSDYVRAWEVVTGDGEQRRVTVDSEADLFWALAGGKGSVGIVTAVEFETLPLEGLYGGYLHFACDDARRVAREWADWCAQLPSEATTSLLLTRVPPLPGIPVPLAQGWSVAVRFAYLGEPDDGAEVIEPIREAADAVIDTLGYLPYSALGSIHNDPTEPMPAIESGLTLRHLTDDALEEVLEALSDRPDGPPMAIEIRQLGGAVASGRPSAFDHRDAAFQLFTIGLATTDTRAIVLETTDAVARALKPWSLNYATPNFTAGDPTLRRVPSYTPQTRARLAEISRAFDPQGVLSEGRRLRDSV